MDQKTQIKYGELAGEIVGKTLVFGFLIYMAYEIYQGLSQVVH